MSDIPVTIKYGEPTEFVTVRIHNEVIVPRGCENDAREWLVVDMQDALKSREADAYLKSEIIYATWEEVDLKACGNRVVDEPYSTRGKSEPAFNPFLRQWLNGIGYTESDWPLNVPDFILADADAEFGRGLPLGEDGYPQLSLVPAIIFDPILYGA